MNPLRKSFLVVCVLSLIVNSAPAADGTWTQLTTNGTWSDIANWSSGAGPIADGSGSTANFSTLNLTADNTVQMNGNHTLTNLIFGDTNTASGGNWILSNNGTSTNMLTLAGGAPTITVNALASSKIATISAGITGSSGLIKDGVGQLNLGTSSSGVLTSGGTSTLTGGVSIKAGTLGLVGPIGAGNITIGDTAGGSTAAATLLMVGLGTNGVIPSYTNAIVLGATSGLLTITAITSGQLSFSGGVTGTNHLIIAENNTGSGTMTFLTGSLNNTGTITNAGSGAVGTSVTISSTIGSNVTGVIQNGTTKLILSGNNTYTGATTVSVGTMLVSGSLAAGSAVSVAGNAVLGGSGTVAGIVTTAAATSVIDPSNAAGTGIGKLTLGSLDATSGGLFRFTLGANTTAGTTYDQLAVTNLLTGSASSGALHFSFTDVGAQTGANYKLLTFGSQSGLDVADFAIDNAGWAGTFTVNANDVTVNFTSVVPEPSTWALLAFSMTSVIILLRRRA